KGVRYDKGERRAHVARLTHGDLARARAAAVTTPSTELAAVGSNRVQRDNGSVVERRVPCSRAVDARRCTAYRAAAVAKQTDVQRKRLRNDERERRAHVACLIHRDLTGAVATAGTFPAIESAAVDHHGLQGDQTAIVEVV